MAETVDVLIVGAGMAGLTAGALLARSGRRVAVFEQHGKLGGYVQYFGTDPTFDASTHLIGGCGPGGWARSVLEETGALERVELLRLEPVYRAVLPQHQYLAAADPERFRQELATLWPGEAPRLLGFFNEMDEIGRGYLGLPEGTPPGGPLLKRQGQTLEQLLDDHTRHPELRAALSLLWIFGGLSPRRVSALHYASLWYQWHHQGSAHVKGGVKLLTQALADVITESGGTVETRMPVKRILRERGRVLGAQVEDGREFHTLAVISTASPHDTFEELLAAEGQTPAGYNPLRSFATSTSAIQMHLLVDGPLETASRTTLLQTTYDPDDAFFGLQLDQPEYPALVCSVLDYQDSERVPPGKHMLSIFTLAPYAREDNWEVPWEERRTKLYRTRPEYMGLKDQLAAAMLQRVEELFPGVSSRIEARKLATPVTMERYTHNMGGAAFGWANVPEQSATNRPGPETPFQGLYLAGHWTFPGGSIADAIVSGRNAARRILARG